MVPYVGLHDDVGRAAVLERVVELQLELLAGHDLVDEQRLGVGVQIGRHRCALPLILQPDQRYVIVHDEPARAGGAIGGADDGLRRRIAGGARQRRHQIAEVARLVHLQRVDGRLAVLGGDDEQGRIVDALLLERVDHALQGLVGLLETVGEDVARRARAVLVAARLPVQTRVGVVGAASVEVVLGQLLPDAHGLEVHAEDGRHAGRPRPVVVAAVDLVQDRGHLLLIVLDGADHAGGRVAPSTLVISGV